MSINLIWYPNGIDYGFQKFNVSVDIDGRYIATLIVCYSYDKERLVYRGAYRPDPSRKEIPESLVCPEVVAVVRKEAKEIDPSTWDAADKKFGWDKDDLYEVAKTAGHYAEEIHGKDHKLATYEYYETMKHALERKKLT